MQGGMERKRKERKKNMRKEGKIEIKLLYIRTGREIGGRTEE